MDKAMAMQVLAGMCVLVLAILFLKNKMKSFLLFLLRAGTGSAAILLVNGLLVKQGIGVSVGLNIISLLTSGTLGFPGVALLFAISALEFL